MRPRAEVTVSSVVAVDPETAFRVFTEEIDAWWKRGPRHRFSPGKHGALRFEPGASGRLVEVYDADKGDVWEVGRVLAWEPGVRLAFEWRIRNFAPHEKTEVEVRFEPAEEGTRVTIEHRGLTALPKEHPARHGVVGPAFTERFGLWWGELLVSMRAHATRAG